MKYFTSIIIPWLSTMFIIWILTPPSQPSWIKHLVFLITMLLQLICFFIILKLQLFQKSEVQREPFFGLTEKLYTITIFTAFAVYIKGLWALTPDTDPVWIKHVFLGLGLAVFAGLTLYFAFKKVDELPDDRFYTNLAKAACFTLLLVLLSFIVLSLVTFFRPFTLTAGMVLIFSAAMIFIFDLAFYVFEKRGG
ncbi:hypothetical protein DDV21_011020 [Streptococcus chenjunshii]|uniref:DUF3796 domain-containing protein n=1 Tax=Streptococcus chenjunshii TaxID=2173853 RepID=A0A372KMP4_9STRE|nr:hypothetical protein [Streptococcus chenjunshii]AXQ79553.1 hypothetical protein DDV21_011020 [Streptococcus chenjunshii]RFU51468.1 hypothetical protein DDV22_03075 [Streptococcus chenjunshii]RFU53551.1 hypothetical protein DDV23_04170 [Streptococcus chenjunshii]